MDEEARLRIIIQTVLDEKAAKEAAESVRKLGTEAKKMGDEVKRSDAFSGMNKSTISLLGTVAKLGVVFTAAVAPINAAAKNYVSSVGMATETSRSWLESNYRIEQSYIRIGEVAAEKLAPIKKIQADLMEGLADFVVDQPGTAGGVTAGVGALGALGGISLVSKLIKGGGLVGLIKGGGATASTGMNALGGVGTQMYGPASSGTSGVVAGGSMGVLALGGLILGTVGLVKGVAELLDEQRREDPNHVNTYGLTDAEVDSQKYSQFPTLNMAAAAALKAQGKQIPTPEELKEEQPAWVQKLVDAINALTGAVENIDKDTGSEFRTTQLIQQQYNFRKQESYAQEDFYRQRMYAQEDFNRNLAYQETDFYRQRSYTLRDFSISMAYTEKMFYIQRQIQARDFNISMSRNEFDYNLSRKRAAEDHNFSLKQIMLSGDALAYYYAQRQYNISKQRAEEDYQISRSRSVEDFNRQQTDSLMFFNMERTQQKKMFEISLADQEREFEIMRERSIWEFERITLPRQEIEYKIMAARRLQSFYDSIIPEIMKEYEMRAYYDSMFRQTIINGYTDMISGMQAYFASISQAYMSAAGASLINPETGRPYGSTLPPKYAEGGYTKPGLATLHANEFVLTANTTKQAEQVAKGTLTQDKIISLLTGGGGMVYNDSRTFSRGLSADEKTAIRQELQQIVKEVLV